MLDDLDLPVLAAPMAGGPSTPAFVIAAARAGSLGQLAGGYKTAAELQAQITEVRAADVAFGVNLFVPHHLPVDPAAYATYRAQLADEGAAGPAQPCEDDDHWQDKLDLLLSDPVPLVSLTFTVPDPAVIKALQRSGSFVVQTVTSAAEAQQAVPADALVVQAGTAGGHCGTFTPDVPRSDPDLLDLIRSIDHPRLIAAGGLATDEQVRAALRAGATKVMAGTALLRTHESGASDTYKRGLAQRTHLQTVVTRAFTGRPARALPNGFLQRHDAQAISGYPAVHHLTSPLRRAAAAAGDDERINLWAGVGHAMARDEPLATALHRLAGTLHPIE